MTSSDSKRNGRVTLKHVAEAVGVSLATVSYALNNGGSVGRETRDRVIAMAEQLGYQPNLSAKAMRTGRTGALGMVLPDLTNPFFPLLAQTVIHAGRAEGYSVFLTDTQGSKEAESQSIDALIQRGVDGIVWFPINDAPDSQPNLQGVPAVVLDRNIEGFDSVCADYATGGAAAAKYLIDAGHRRIGILAGPGDVSSSRIRTDAARAYVEAHAHLAWQLEAAYSADLDQEIVHALTRGNATAIVAGSDLIAIGAIQALQRADKRVPEDVSVVGFDNIAWGEWCVPGLTTIDMPVTEIGVEAVALLLRRIRAPDEPRRRVVFDVALVERMSVLPPTRTQAARRASSAAR